MTGRARMLAILLGSLACAQRREPTAPEDTSAAAPTLPPAVEPSEPEPQPEPDVQSTDEAIAEAFSSSFNQRTRADARVRHVKGKVDGPLDADLVRRIIRAHIHEIRHCYEAGLDQNRSLRGEVILEFTIDTAGLVTASTAVDPDSFGDPEVPACMADAVRRWKFPKPDGGEVRVRYTFSLEI